MMRRGSRLLATLLPLFLLGGCATKIDLYDYKDVSSVNVIDLQAADYRVEHPTLDRDITVESHADRSYSAYARDAFMQANSRKRVFDVTDANATYRARIILYSLDHSREYVPPVFVKTEKGGYYTKPYWSYVVRGSMGAEVTRTGGTAEYYEATYSTGFTVEGSRQNRHYTIGRDKYHSVIRSAANNLIAQIGNDVAPEGLIIGKKVHVDDEEEMIFLINMGRADGISSQQTLQVYKSMLFKNEIDARTDASKVLIGRATVSDQVSAHRAWIVMNDEADNRKVDVGDSVRARYR